MAGRTTIDFSMKGIFIVAFSLILLYILYLLRDILVLFFIAFILSSLARPAVDWLERRKVPRTLSVLSLYLALALSIYVLLSLIAPPVSEQVQELIARRQFFADRLLAYLRLAPASLRTFVFETISDLPQRLAALSSQVLLQTLGLVSSLLGVLTVIVVTFFLLIQKTTLQEIVPEFWPAASSEWATDVAYRMVTKITMWARGQVALSGAVGLLILVGLLALRVPFALVLAVFAAFTEFIPLIGPYIGAIPALVIAFSISPASGLSVIALYVAVQLVEANVLVPAIMKKAIGLSPTVIIFSLLVGGRLLGLVGVIVAVPIASSLSVLLEEYKKRRDEEAGRREAADAAAGTATGTSS